VFLFGSPEGSRNSYNFEFLTTKMSNLAHVLSSFHDIFMPIILFLFTFLANHMALHFGYDQRNFTVHCTWTTHCGCYHLHSAGNFHSIVLNLKGLDVVVYVVHVFSLCPVVKGCFSRTHIIQITQAPIESASSFNSFLLCFSLEDLTWLCISGALCLH
jgi:hypothetical protein